MTDTAISQIRDTGFTVAEVTAKARLAALRDTVVEEAARLCGAAPTDPAEFLNKFHDRGLTGHALNDFRVELIRNFNANIDCGEEVFAAFRPTLLELVGPDVAVQKSCNIVIHQPGDADVSPIHRDSPPNSPFEVVLWIPLVDCYGTKGMSVLGLDQTQSVLADLHASDRSDAEAVYEGAARIGKAVDAPFGTALFFWTGLMHVIPVNHETETRWSLNIRYKNVFSPYGTKKLPDFFRILRLSPMAELAFARDRRELGLRPGSTT